MIWVLIMVISGGHSAAIHTQEFNQETTCKMAAEEFKKLMADSWKSTYVGCMQK